MKTAAVALSMTANQKESLEETVKKERSRLLAFIRKRVPVREEAEDILQDVFYQLTENFPLFDSLERISSWLFTVARNKITDRYRKHKPQPFSQLEKPSGYGDKDDFSLANLIPDISARPDMEHLRGLIWQQLQVALDELPEEQRWAFLHNEFEGRSFRELSTETGVPISTLITRKRYAVLYIREKLQELYQELIELSNER
ncbi:MAG: RNA polymerase sigma factor [Bacteroidota bacterium]